MRISVRQQLSLILVISGCIGLAVLAIAVWSTNENFVLTVAGSKLTTTASLRAAEVAFNLALMQTAATFVTTRAIIQRTLQTYNNGSDTNPELWTTAQQELAAALGNVGPLQSALILQTQVFSRNTSGPRGADSVLNVTGKGGSDIVLPWSNEDGTQVRLGDDGIGYPSSLYPNLTIIEQPGSTPAYLATYNGKSLGLASTLVLGPLVVNQSFSLISMTLPMTDNTNTTDILGWVTVLFDAWLIQYVIQDQTGLGKTGQTLLLGSTNTTNQFGPGILGTEQAGSNPVRFLLPLNNTSENRQRHASHVFGGPNAPFPANAFPAVEAAMKANTTGTSEKMIRTHNEEDMQVSVGYSIPPSSLVQWIVVVEQARSEVWEPINHLRNIILACLFSVIGFLLVISFPISHWFVLPIIRLRAATEDTIDTPHGHGSDPQKPCCGVTAYADEKSSGSTRTRKENILFYIARWRDGKLWPTSRTVESSEKGENRFRVPGKVRERKQWAIKDEMSDLVKTFNEMSDELFVQYNKLEDRVRQRTVELEHSKRSAEAANESKTLFVANVSHELKTPLNGIMGMCAVCMEEEDPKKLKSSLGIIYKSGDLLLRTLTDLLTFSSNQVGQLKLDEKEFTLKEMEAQITSIFGQQAKDNCVDLRVQFQELPSGVSSDLREMTLWGDIHRILQVIINLISNSLKFTPPQGSVVLSVRSLSELPVRGASVKPEESLRQRRSAAVGSFSAGTANFINPHELELQGKSSPPAGKDMFLEFEVRDTGPGIPVELHHKIFEPFVQGDAGLSRKHSGTGLGLSICSQLASLMKGVISLESTVGEGSVFTLKLPLRQVLVRTVTPASSTANDSRRPSGASIEPFLSRQSTMNSGVPVVSAAIIPSDETTDGTEGAADRKTPHITASAASSISPLKQAVKNATKEAKSKKEAKQDFSKIRVLVAEDNKVNQEVILRMLKLEQILDVTIAQDGQVALDLVTTKPNLASSDGSSEESDSPYDLIFMDVQMPNMDGLTSTKLIRASGFKKPIIALTAFSEQSNVDECYGSGMDYFLAKPIRRPQLKMVLTEYCTPSPLPDSP